MTSLLNAMLRGCFLLALFIALAPPHASAAADAGGFTRDQLVAELTRELTSHFNLEGELQLELVRPWTPPTRTALVWTLSVLEFPSMPASSMLVRCRLVADATPVADITAVVRAMLWRDAWVSRQPLVVGTTFSPTLVEPRRTDLFRDREALPVTAGDRFHVVARALPAGRLLTWRDISRRPLVRKGELVEVSAVDGSLLVTLRALAMESGGQGETVTLRNPESRRNFSATVVDENRVQVRF